MIVFIEVLFDALSLAGIYLLVALGVTLIFGLTRIVFFAQGELVTLGAFVALSLTQLHVPVALALLGAAVVVGVLAELLDLGIFRRTLTRPFNGFVISLGLIVALEAAYALRWSGDFYLVPAVYDGVWQIGGIIITKERVVLVVVTVALAAALFAIIDRTHYGRGIRALAEDRVSAQAMGVRVSFLLSAVFLVGSALAALAGGLLGTIFPFTAFFGGTFLLKAFAVAIVGGLGNIRGAVVAALALAFTESFGAAYISIEWSYAILLIVMILIIIVRPQGLFASSGHSAGDPLAGAVLVDDEMLAPAATTQSRLMRYVPRFGVFAIFIAGLLAPLLLPTDRSIELAVFVLVNAIGVYSMWFAFRFAGLFSIAQAAFVGIGAYATAAATLHWHLNFWLALAVAIVAAGFGAAVYGVIAFRASGSYQIIILFALTELQVVILQNLVNITGGAGGVVMPTPPDPLPGLVSIDFQNPSNLYYLVFGFTCAVIALLWGLSRTSFGTRLTSLRDNEALAQSLGLNTFRHKLAALVVCGACAGIGGSLYLYAQVAVEPDYFSSNASIQMALMMLLGGVGTLIGPMIGAVVTTFLPEFLNLSPYQSQLMYGVLLIAIIVGLPGGVVGSVRRLYFNGVTRLGAR